MLNKLITGGVHKAVVCGLCCLEGHPTDACPTLQRGDVNAMLTKAKGSVTHTPTVIIKGEETTLTLGMDLGTTPQILTNHHVKHLLRIEQISF